MKKVYLFIKSIAKKAGGAERVVVNVANELCHKFDITILSFEPEFGSPFYSLDKRVKTFNLYPRYRKAGKTDKEVRLGLISNKLKVISNSFDIKKLDSISDRAKWESDYGVFLNHLTKYLEAYPPDVLISFLPSAFSVCSLACQRANVPHIVSEHNVPEQDFANPERWDSNPYDIKLRWESLYKANAITVLFDEFKEWFPQELHSKIHVITNYVSPPIKPHIPILNRKKRIVAVGRLAFPKNHDILLEAWSKIEERHPDWKVEIYGNGPLKKELNAKIKDLELKNLKLMGVSNNVWDIYADSQIFCIPSRFEGFGLVTVEALMMDLPAVGFAECHGTNRIIKSEAGILVESMDADRLSIALDNLISDDELREQMSLLAANSVSGYHKNNIIPKWIDLIESI